MHQVFSLKHLPAGIHFSIFFRSTIKSNISQMLFTSTIFQKKNSSHKYALFMCFLTHFYFIDKFTNKTFESVKGLDRKINGIKN